MREFLEHLEWQAQSTPAYPAIIDGSQTVSYSALAAWTDAIATQIREQSLDPKKPIAFLGFQGINLIVAFLASQKAGYPFLPINRIFPPKLVGKLLMLSNSSLCITDQNTIFRDELASVQTLTLAPQPSDQLPKFQLASVDERAIALLHCSSGSSGDPKIVPHSRMALKGYINLHRDEYRLTQTDVVAHMNNFWLESVMATFSVGATLSCFDPSRGSLSSVTERMLSEKISVLPLYPALLRTFQRVGVCLPKLRLVMVSGEAITKSDVTIFESITSTGSILLNCYASQEAIWVTSYRHRNGELMQAQSLPLGRPVDRMEVQVLSKDGSFLPSGEIGEITIKSYLLPSGYLGDYNDGTQRFYNDQDRTPTYASQDLGYLDSSGNLHYVARQDDQVKIRGHLVSIKEVERVISEVLASEEVAVSIRLAPNNRKQLVCYYISADVVAPRSIIKMLQTQLPNYMIPSFFNRLDKLPKTPSGKISRRQLENIQLAPEYSIAIPAENIREKVVAELMAEVLGHSDFSSYDDFFDIGGDSLATLNLILKIETKFDVRFSRDLFLEGASVKDIASSLEQEQSDTELVTVRPLNYSKTDTVFFAIPVLDNNLYHYSALGDALIPAASLLGLRFSEDMYSDLASPNPLEKFANVAATKIIERLDGREINLVGFSSAGILACETANRLNALGYDISSLVLFDSHPAGYQKFRLSFLPNFIGWRLRKFYRWVLHKDNARTFKTFSKFQFHAQLYAQLADWSPMPIQINRVIFFKPQDGDVDDSQIEKWQRTAKGRLLVIPTRGVHNSIKDPNVALHIAQILTGKLERIEDLR
jgi:acyl-coenzyme A synthetase/AMP-(fatty) acid ligase/thioesterase domain-containing protein|tara:strand:+ start:1799 stop:4258 length:2460 start_codon:yes stop_codon:yes gene_type:complete